MQRYFISLHKFYPAPTEDVNLKNICFLKNEFGVEVGLSDHTEGDIAAIASVLLVQQR